MYQLDFMLSSMLKSCLVLALVALIWVCFLHAFSICLFKCFFAKGTLDKYSRSFTLVGI